MVKPKAKAVKRPRMKNVAIMALTEVDRTFYELSINDISTKIDRLKLLQDEFIQKNNDLEVQIQAVGEEHKDTVNYYKRLMNNQKQEIEELNEKIIVLQEDDLEEIFQKNIREAKKAYKEKHEELSNNIKALHGQINTLEEFRLQKNELLEKYDMKEKEVEENEVIHKKNIYEMHRLFSVGRDVIKKRLEQNLLQISTNFQNVTTTRITTTTQRVVRENIAIQNDLELIFETNNRLKKENDELENLTDDLKLQAESNKTQKYDALKKISTQLKLIRILKERCKSILDILENTRGIEFMIDELRTELNNLYRNKEALEKHLKILKQNFHGDKCDENSIETELEHAASKYNQISTVVYNVVMTVRSFAQEYARKEITRSGGKDMLRSLLAIMENSDGTTSARSSIESVPSVSKVYKIGDLGFEPVAVPLRSSYPILQNKEVQITPSFEELLVSEQSTSLSSERIESDKEEIEIEEKGAKSIIESISISPLKKESFLFDKSSELSSASSSKSTQEELEEEELLNEIGESMSEEVSEELLLDTEEDDESVDN